MNEQPIAADQPAEFEQLKDFARTYGKTVTLFLAILLVAVIGIRLYRSHRQSTMREASALFATARSVQDLEALVNEFGSAPASSLVKLRLAKSYFGAADYDLAMKTYEGTKRDDPTHPLTIAADLGLAHCLEAKGQTEDALRGFEEFLKKHPNYFLTAQAVFGKARCLDQLTRTADAKAVIEDYIAGNPDSRWLAPAEEMMDTLNEKLETVPGE